MTRIPRQAARDRLPDPESPRQPSRSPGHGEERPPAERAGPPPQLVPGRVIVRRHEDGGTESAATYSRCERYRYALERRWAEGARLVYVMLNPSTACERRNDPTIARCEARARALGYAAFAAVNLFAFRATRPADLRGASDPVGPLNDTTIRDVATGAALVLCGWGVHGALGGRGEAIARLLRAGGHPLAHLGLTRDGHPRHPLYVGYRVRPALWTE